MNFRILILDNYDSFTYNLVDYLTDLDGNPMVYTNDAISLDEIVALSPTHIVISPGPGRPENERDFGVCKEVVLDLLSEHPRLKHRPPLMGVCLGHQGIIHYAGGKIMTAPTIRHGKRNTIEHNKEGIFSDLPSPLSVMRYHSLIGDLDSLPATLEATAVTIDDPSGQKILMAIRHRRYPIYGVQFHPESIGTPEGKRMLGNFLEK